MIEISLKPHQGPCLYSGDVAKPDKSAAQRLFLDSRLPFIACKNIHQHLDNGLSIFINAQEKSDILSLFALPFYVLPYMTLRGSSGNLFLRALPSRHTFACCRILHPVFSAGMISIQKRKKCSESLLLLCLHTRKAAACEIMVHLVQSVLEAAHSENTLTIKGDNFKRQI